MIYQIETEIFRYYPSFCRGVIIVSEADNTPTSIPLLEELFRARLKAVENNEEISLEHPRINAWREIYKTFPLKDARRIQPSIASLVKRIKQGSNIPFISPLVCISNLISLTHLVPSGLIDIDKVVGNLSLGFADGAETFQPIGDDKTTNPVKDEIIYFDTGNKNVMCRAWNSRGGKSTFILPSTENAVIDVDGLTNVLAESEIKEATNSVGELVTKFCNAKVKTYLLNKGNPVIEF
jgi:DNA/RNA-binding domain of Phe-tRNA-synthetase-like protein